MKLTSLTIIFLVVLGCVLASAQTPGQTYAFGFVSADGVQFCNYELMQQYSSNSAIWEGLDVLDACGIFPPVEATIVGATANIPAANNPVHVPIKGVVYADNLYDATNYGYTGIQWFVLTALTPSTSKYGWVGFASYEGIIYGAEYGYLTATLPDVKTSSHILSNGKKVKPKQEPNSQQDESKATQH